MDLLAQMQIAFGSFLAYLTAIGWASLIKALAEAFIIAYAAAWVWSRIRGTQAERLVKGILVLIGICLVSWLAGFTLITTILQQLIPVTVLALLIVFQPEIRRGLGYLGRGKAFKLDLTLSDSQRDRTAVVIEQLITAVRELARTKTGALIVVEPPEGERDYLSPGISVNADISSNLLLCIFFPTSPLHDGAVIIRKDKMVAAGVILPMTDNPKISYRYGTRHRAAIGLSEVYDALCIVVSEETGHISAASRGMLVRYQTADELAEPLSYIYQQGVEGKSAGPLQSFLALFGRNSQRATDTEYGAPAGQPSAETTFSPPGEEEKPVSYQPAVEQADTP